MDDMGVFEEFDEGVDDGPDSEDMADYTQELLQRCNKARLLAVTPDGAQSVERTNALYYYQGQLDQVTDFKDNIPTEKGRSSVTSLALAENVETMMPVIMDIVTDKETIAFRSRRGEPADIAKAETDAVYSMIYEENPGWQLVYDAIWDAAVGRYGVLVVGNDTSKDGAPYVCIDTIDPGDVLYVSSARSAKRSPYWGIVYRYTDEEFERMGWGNPEDYQSAPMTNDQRTAALDNAGVTYDDFENVGIIEHYLPEEDGWLRVTTDYGMTTVFEVYQLDFLPVCWATLFRRPHSLVGWSAYDRVKGPQKSKTVLMRTAMDTAQYAQTNRPVLNKRMLLPETISQLQVDAPSVPIIVDGDPGAAIRPLYASTQLPFDVMGMLEYFEADQESRTGAGRNLQGIDAEALHESMRVGMQMENRQQMRMRTTARHIAETFICDLFEAVHGMARLIEAPLTGHSGDQDESAPMTAGMWGPSYGARAIVDIKGGSEAAQSQAAVIKGVLADLITVQGGPEGPFVNGENILNAARTNLQAAGVEDTSQYIAKEFQAPPAQPPQPDPEVIKAQMDAQAKQQDMQLKAQSDAMEHDYRMAQLEADKKRAILEDNYKRDQADAELAQRERIAAAELAEKQRQFNENLAFQREQMLLDVGKHQAELKADAEISGGNVRVGGEPG